MEKLGWVVEMRNQKRTLLVITFSFLLILIPNGISINQTIPIMANEAEPAAIDIMQMIPNPYLETEPDAFVSGTSDEFEYNYNSSHDIMQLNWTHTKGTTLEFISDNDEETPCYNDFVFFTQSFEWPYEEMPEKAEGCLNYSVTLTDGFTNSSTHSMFRVYAWFIDSSANWRTIYYSNPPYSFNFQERRMQINYFSLLYGFGGMIEYTPGIQEDPQDILKVGIGLAPTIDFQNSLDNGSVIVEVTSMTLYVVMEAEPDPATHLTHLYNDTYGSIIGDTFPFVTNAADTCMDFLYGMTTDPMGDIYVTGASYTGYELKAEQGLYGYFQYLIKYSPTLQRLWVVRNDNLTNGRAITYHDGYIYTTGYVRKYDPYNFNLILTKWTLGGQRVWHKEWGGDYDQIGVAIGVHDDGSIYVVVSDLNLQGSEGEDYMNSSLLKFDSSGEVIWNRPLPLCTYFDASGDLWVFESHIVYYLSGVLMCWDLDGAPIWDEAAWAATCDENGTVYAGETTGIGVGIEHLDLQGNRTWSTLYQTEYENGWLEDLRPSDMAITNQNDLLVLAQGNRYDYSYLLLKYSLNGTHLQTWSIGNIGWPRPGVYSPMMEVTSTGLVYFAFVPMTSDVWIEAYAIGDYTLPPFSLDAVMLAAIGGVIGVVALISIYVYKKKQS